MANGNGNGKKKVLDPDLKSILADMKSYRTTIDAAMSQMITTTEAAVSETDRLRNLLDRALSKLEAVTEELDAQKKELDIQNGGSGNFNLKKIFLVTHDASTAHKEMKAELDEITLARQLATGGAKKEAPQEAAEGIFPEAPQGDSGEPATSNPAPSGGAAEPAALPGAGPEGEGRVEHPTPPRPRSPFGRRTPGANA